MKVVSIVHFAWLTNLLRFIELPHVIIVLAVCSYIVSVCHRDSSNCTTSFSTTVELIVYMLVIVLASALVVRYLIVVMDSNVFIIVSVP